MPKATNSRGKGRPFGSLISEDAIEEVNKFFSLYPSKIAGARALGITKSTMFYWLSGSWRPSRENAIKMKEIAFKKFGIGLSVGKMLDNEEQAYEESSPPVFALVVGYLAHVCNMKPEEYIANYIPFPLFSILNNNINGHAQFWEIVYHCKR